MQDRSFHETYDPYPRGSGGGDPSAGWCRPGRGVVRTALMWAALALVVFLAFGTAMWALGLVFHLLGLLLRIALITAVVALVWRRVTRRPHRHGSI
jgi:hypothetical protein